MCVCVKSCFSDETNVFITSGLFQSSVHHQAKTIPHPRIIVTLLIITSRLHSILTKGVMQRHKILIKLRDYKSLILLLSYFYVVLAWAVQNE